MQAVASGDRRSIAPNWPLAAAIILLIAVAYLPAMRGGFIWDDDQYVTGNITLRSADGLRRVWTEPGATPQYYPLVFTTFWIEHHLWGDRPAGHHIVNVALHCLSSLVLWRLLRKLEVPGAWLAAALFAAHPVNVESVAWITERKNVLSGLFYLLATAAYFRFDPPREPVPSRRWSYYQLSMALFLSALLSKTVTCTLPAAIGLAMWWKRGRIRPRDVAALLPMLIVGMGMGIVTAMLERRHVGASGPDWDFSVADRVLIAGRASWFYLAKLFWPVDLTFIYPRWTIDAADWKQWLFPIGAIGTLALLWAMRRRWSRGPLAAALFLGGTLAPALGFINVYPMLFSFVADHFQYLAMIGPLTLFAACLAISLRRAPFAFATASAVILCCLSALTWRQSRIYADLQTLWNDTLAKNQDAWIAHNNLAPILLEQGDLAGARFHADAALKLRPGYGPACNTLGRIDEAQGRIPQAMEDFRRAVEWREPLPAAHLNLANLLAQADRLAEAEAEYRAAVKAGPRLADAHHNLAAFLLATGRAQEALAEARTAASLDPWNSDARGLYGLLLAISGDRAAAERELGESLRLNPANQPAKEAIEEIRRTPPRP